MENELLKVKQIEIAERLIPAIVPTALMSVTGIVGNILAIVFFSIKSKQTVSVVLIKYLAVADLATCIVSISVISEMVLNIRYDTNALIICKVTHFMGNWTIGSSCALLTAINIDRYRKICFPFSRQIQVFVLRYIAIGIVLFFMLSSARLLATFDIVKVNTTVTNSTNFDKILTGLHCAASCDDNYETLCLIFYFVDFTVIVVALVSAIYLYSRIIYTLLKHKHEISRLIQYKRSVKQQTDNRTKMESNDETEATFNKGHDGITSQQKCRTPSQNTLVVLIKKHPVEWNITLIMFATTVVFLLCFTPYFIIRILLRLVLKADEENNYNAMTQFCLKLPYFNSTANPIIYSIINVKFRRFIKTLVLRCFKCFRK